MCISLLEKKGNEQICIDAFIIFQLLDLFSLENGGRSLNGTSNSRGTLQSQSISHVSIQSMLNTLPDLWEDKQYEEEYDMNTFLNSLRK